MDLSVVVPTLNGRDRLAASLDALAEHAPDVEVVVVNGPSADGTTGMVRSREDVDVLVEVSSRTLNVARNAGIETASGGAIAFLRDGYAVEGGWREALADGLAGADVVTGPARQTLRAGVTTAEPERRTIAGREVAYFDGGNVAFDASVLAALDGFDEYLETGGARDLAHRLPTVDCEVVWAAGMDVRHGEYEPDGGSTECDWRWKYRSLAYRLVKNYGLRPTVVRRVLSHAARDATTSAREVAEGGVDPTNWVASGRDVVGGITAGARDGLVARARDRSPSCNPHGLSTRTDRVVARYDLR